VRIADILRKEPQTIFRQHFEVTLRRIQLRRGEVTAETIRPFSLAANRVDDPPKLEGA
jgi:hypothetical protein